MSRITPVAPTEPIVHPSGASRALLDDGRWHFQHGPIDLIIGAEGDPESVQAALSGAWERFTQILPELVGELPLLRGQATLNARTQGPVAARMFAACEPYALQTFVTPMAAVAGSVADDLIGFFSGQAGVRRAYVNNGGDIALHIGPGQSYRVGMFSDLGRYQGKPVDLDGAFMISAQMPIRGIATSGWRGRSFSMGIADSVTVLAGVAARADVAATLIANEVYADHNAVRRAPADTIKDDTDLGSRLVTVDVGPLPQSSIDAALDSGAAFARRLHGQGLIHTAVLMLQGSVRVVGEQNNPRQAGETPRLDIEAIAGRQAPAQSKVQKESHV
ncbi:UPF0280 family protein [Pusillimonas sp.]|uniref:UPF0280 family protein n=1 Tax=Pusillimonas sp. TaxID=3040095 RepID=UPI0037C95B03